MEKVIPLKAKILMDENKDAIILDVREFEEYLGDGHLPGAELIPLGELVDRAFTDLPDKNAAIFVYCRSGQRSAMAASMLDNMGYTNIYDIGGIIDWPFEIEK